MRRRSPRSALRSPRWSLLSHTTTASPRRRRSVGVAASPAICGRCVPARSRGTSICTCPVASVFTVFPRVPPADVVTGRVAVLLMPEVLGHLLVQRGLQDRFGQLLEQTIRPGQGQALLPSSAHHLHRRLLLRRSRNRWLLLRHVQQCRHRTAPSPPTRRPSVSSRKHRSGYRPPFRGTPPEPSQVVTLVLLLRWRGLFCSG